MTESKTYRRVKFALQFIMYTALVLSILRGNWLNSVFIVGVIFLTLLPLLLGRRWNIYVPPEFEITIIVFVFASMFLGELGDFYERFWWWDAALHTSSGVIIGIFGFLLVYFMNHVDTESLSMSPLFVALFALFFAIALGGLWEIFEFAMDSWFGLNMQKSGLDDTMWDLIVDTVGATFASVLGYLYITQGRDSFIGRGIEKFVEGNAARIKGEN